MLLTLDVMKNVPLMGIQTGRRLGVIGDPIINPNNLQVIAWYVNGNMIGFSPAVIFSEDIHELGHLGAIVDSADSILPLDNLVRLQEILDYNFTMHNLPVFDNTGRKLGVVESFNFDSDDFLIKQIIIKPNIGVRLKTSQLIVARSQIVEINNKKIIVNSTIQAVPTMKKLSIKKPKTKRTKKTPRPSANPVPETKHV